MRRPRKRLIKAFVMDPLPKDTTLVRPKSTMAKYSGVEKVKANLATGCDRVTMMAADRRPPKSAAYRVHPRALAGCPFRAMAYPSQRRGTWIGSPGLRHRMDGNAP